MAGIKITYPFDEVYFIIDSGSKDAWISSKPVRDLTIWEIEGIDRDGHYFSTKEKAEVALRSAISVLQRLQKHFQ